MFPDFSAETQWRHHSFNDVYKRMREKGLQYSMLYPSKLKVQHNGVKFFDAPQVASDWLDAIP